MSWAALDDYATRSGFLVTPVVVRAGPAGTLVRQSSEVARIHLIPLADFDHLPELLRIPESPAPVLRLALLGGHVYAPTAAIIYQFCQLALHGLTTRVAHFEQPVSPGADAHAASGSGAGRIRRGAKWGAVIGRRQATPSLLKRSISAI